MRFTLTCFVEDLTGLDTTTDRIMFIKRETKQGKSGWAARRAGEIMLNLMLQTKWKTLLKGPKHDIFNGLRTKGRKRLSTMKQQLRGVSTLLIVDIGSHIWLLARPGKLDGRPDTKRRMRSIACMCLHMHTDVCCCS
jgi:hypothetical protein